MIPTTVPITLPATEGSICINPKKVISGIEFIMYTSILFYDPRWLWLIRGCLARRHFDRRCTSGGLPVLS